METWLAPRAMTSGKVKTIWIGKSAGKNPNFFLWHRKGFPSTTEFLCCFEFKEMK